jgi:TolB-like protein
MDSANSSKQAEMSIIDELRRRNVIRVGVAYVIIAWVIAKGAEIALDGFATPPWLMNTILFVLIIGFPTALIFSWAYELTLEGIKLEKDVARSGSITHITGRKLDIIIFGVLVVALVLFSVDKFVWAPDTTKATDSAQKIVATEIQQSVAVLPFVNMSDDPGNEYFSDGLSEEILNLLARIPGLKVIGRTSSFAFKGKNEDLRVIGQTLGVTTVLEGSVRKSGERVRITAQLVDVSDGTHIWSESYDRTMTDIFAVQDDVAAAIIDALQIHVGANPTRGRPTENTEAYALFLKARASLNVFEYRNAEKIALEAIELDGNFAEAYELLAFTYWAQASEIVKAAEGQKLMGEAAGRALAINPDLVLAQAMYQSGNIETWSLLGEIEAFERVIRKHPGNSAPLRALAWYLLKAGYLQEALTVSERYVEYEPLSPAANNRLSEVLFAVGRTNEAIAALELADQLGSTAAMWAIGTVKLVEKQDDIAIAHFEAMLQQYDYSDSSWVRELVTAARNPATGQAYLNRRIPQIVASLPEEYAYDMHGRLTSWYLLFGFLDRYFELILDLDLSVSTWTDADVIVWEGTMFRRLGFTAHPKYLEVAELLGIVELWEQRGPPDFCEKLDSQWICE